MPGDGLAVGGVSHDGRDSRQAQFARGDLGGLDQSWIGVDQNRSDVVAGRVRIRAVGAADDVVLDAQSGIDPASLRRDGAAVTWTRGGVLQRAELP